MNAKVRKVSVKSRSPQTKFIVYVGMQVPVAIRERIKEKTNRLSVLMGRKVTIIEYLDVVSKLSDKSIIKKF